VPESVNMGDVVSVSQARVTIRKSRRRATIPKDVVDRYGIGDMDTLVWVVRKDGTLTVYPVKVTDEDKEARRKEWRERRTRMHRALKT